MGACRGQAGGRSKRTRTRLALELMMQFAARTGLEPEGPQRRYLWTDAFAVTNFLGLHYRELALKLIDRVHRTRPPPARPSSAGQRGHGLDQRTRGIGGRRASDGRRPADRQAARGAFV